MRGRLACLLLALWPATAAAGPCEPAPTPVLGLDFQSRYDQGDATRSDLIEEREAAAEAAIAPLDDFIRSLGDDLEALLSLPAEGTARRDAADCLVARMAEWARADALVVLGSRTARLTIGSRLAGLAIVADAAARHASDSAELEAVKAWLDRRMGDQMRFWERAPDRAAQNNLRAWAALGGAATAALTGDPVTRAWSVWSVAYVICSANGDGSLPQEMSRGNRALQYQLHALAPLVTAVAILERDGVPLLDRCDGALGRAVRFAIADLDDGAATRALTGEVQSFFDGTDTLEPFHLAWIEAWLHLVPDARIEALAAPMRPLSYSKLGGNQTLLWGQGDG
jgi:poly(beta-D-mannuronate) lyase